MRLNYPTGWYGESEKIDEFTIKLLTIVKRAGKDISYKKAGEMIDEVTK